MPSETKLTFRLSEEQAGPFPVSTESLWCSHETEGFRIRNVPFFLDDVSFDDVIAVQKLDDGSYVIKEVLVPSGNSTIWLYLKDPVNSRHIVDQIIALGCAAESGVIKDYYAINVPQDVPYKSVYELIHTEESRGRVLVDYPSTRHDTR